MAPNQSNNSMTLKRIHREVADLKKDQADLGGITLAPTDNLYIWKATIPGPEGSCYEGGVFEVQVQLASDYPFSAPKVIFLTRIYHMNISDRGNVCIDILKHNWSPALSIFKVILSLSSLLTDPNPRDPLVPSIANEYLRNREQYNRTALHWTHLYARPRAPSPPIDLTPSSAASTTISNKGKSRASQHTSVSRASTSTPTELDPVPSPSHRTKRTRSEVEDTEVIDLTGGDTPSSSAARPRPSTSRVKKRRTEAAQLNNDEAIVIED